MTPTPDDGLEWRDTVTAEDLIKAPDDPLHAEAYVGALLEEDPPGSGGAG